MESEVWLGDEDGFKSVRWSSVVSVSVQAFKFPLGGSWRVVAESPKSCIASKVYASEWEACRALQKLLSDADEAILSEQRQAGEKYGAGVQMLSFATPESTEEDKGRPR